jgi:dihydrodipicolinate synthase/N-acetylneuraminate lyase
VKNYEELKADISRPIISVPTFFSQNGKQDLSSVRQSVEFAIKNGHKTLLLTSSDSDLFNQTEEEIRLFAEAVINQTAGRAAVIAGTNAFWWRDKIISYAKYVSKLGANGVMVLNPFTSGDVSSTQDNPDVEDKIVETYNTVADSVECGVILCGFFTMKVLKRLAEIPGIVGLKEDMGDSWCHDAISMVGKKINIFCGGQKWRFLYEYLLGVKGYITTFGMLAPKITHKFWEAIKNKEFEEAVQIIEFYENPFYEYALNHPKGFLPVAKASFEIFERGPRWMRPPIPSFNDNEMKELKNIFKRMDLI